MLGDVADFVSRLRRVLPTRWFGDAASHTDSVLAGFGVAWSAIYVLIKQVRSQARISSATDTFLDLISADYFGNNLPRRDGESDCGFRTRVGFELLRPRGTREALVAAINELTGQSASVFEPARPADTGGYSIGGVGYCAGGAWGSLALPFQSFLTVQRPHGGGIAWLAGYGTGGVLAYGGVAMIATPVTDKEIYLTAEAIIPVGYQTWIQIQG